MNADEKYMRAAIGQARKAGAIGEVPIGWGTGGWKAVPCM